MFPLTADFPFYILKSMIYVKLQQDACNRCESKLAS